MLIKYKPIIMLGIDNFEYIYELFLKTKTDELNYIYRGQFSSSITDNILSLAERRIEQTDEAASVKKKVYFIMVECLQNITRYQAEETNLFDKSSYFVIQKKQEHYYITTGNLIKSSKVQDLKNRLEKVNNLNEEDLKTYYKKVLTNGQFSEKGGAGLGLINMARKSGNKLSYSLQKINDQYSYYYLNTEILSKKAKQEGLQVTSDSSALNHLIKIHKYIRDYNILFIFNTDFNQDNLIGLLGMIEKQVISGDLRKKVFNILVEILQNIIHHGGNLNDEDLINKPGIIFIAEDNSGENYILSAGNYVKNTEKKIISEKLDEVNAMNNQELTDFYDQRLFDFEIDTSQKAGLGIIDIRIKSENKITYTFNKVNEKYSFFLLQTIVKKN